MFYYLITLPLAPAKLQQHSDVFPPHELLSVGGCLPPLVSAPAPPRGKDMEGCLHGTTTAVDGHHHVVPVPTAKRFMLADCPPSRSLHQRFTSTRRA